MLQFLADENIAGSIVELLRSHGYEVCDVKEQGWFGKPDTFLISLATKKGYVVLTNDKDFTYQEKVPVLLLRFKNQKPRHILQYLSVFLTVPELQKLKKPLIAVLSEEGVTFFPPQGL